MSLYTLYYYIVTVFVNYFLLANQVEAVLKTSELGCGGKETVLSTQAGG